MLQQHLGQATLWHLRQFKNKLANSVSKSYICLQLDFISQFITKLYSFRCVDSCIEQGYDYAGLQYKTQCICANEEPHGAKQNESMCDYTCPGDASAKCGGHWMMNVYQIAPAGKICFVMFFIFLSFLYSS